MNVMAMNSFSPFRTINPMRRIISCAFFIMVFVGCGVIIIGWIVIDTKMQSDFPEKTALTILQNKYPELKEYSAFSSKKDIESSFSFGTWYFAFENKGITGEIFTATCYQIKSATEYKQTSKFSTPVSGQIFHLNPSNCTKKKD
jgi:hypothetical protein